MRWLHCVSLPPGLARCCLLPQSHTAVHGRAHLRSGLLPSCVLLHVHACLCVRRCARRCALSCTLRPASCSARPSTAPTCSTRQACQARFAVCFAVGAHAAGREGRGSNPPPHLVLQKVGGVATHVSTLSSMAVGRRLLLRGVGCCQPPRCLALPTCFPCLVPHVWTGGSEAGNSPRAGG